MDKNVNIFEIIRYGPTFPELYMTKLVVKQGTVRYQMKDYLAICPLVFWWLNC